ncbi:hypothetical protein C343_05838 [Cryptococcus neoformans C23]|uniref:Uncharacterized protein n=1 Tax=Cryptococcus neoformans Tu259-1 TaxID=1230072 RepID=A0A854QBC1_CRYNE|nr:hypothetical protein C347_05877 [Cryptococcus neoformans var. grubii AD2-60a]OWZ32964.1 hypothetical protein C353_05736 [Cryptococcus neoformans var. grubii AD1-83a]OWZ39757.1 hypothetical protein C343_05838 [Cryptococcus neoformans var. grubii C23]OWZ50835.1 hypothetical protein C368_05991 [Cryptococcus neoformans var. grubii 125.91]OXC82214.1 hypothetical protein C344_05556 [Cryptococcus neoformans var. grubii AD1-7a]OXG12904.1 hypothetical protein C361_06092 [Cryptococcus neoformans var.
MSNPLAATSGKILDKSQIIYLPAFTSTSAEAPEELFANFDLTVKARDY